MHCCNPPKDELVGYHHQSLVETMFQSIYRDWSAEGAIEREECYKPIIDSLKELIPVKEGEKPKVLVPGSGLSRLAWVLLN